MADPARILRTMGTPGDPWQNSVLRSEHPRRAMLAARQVGKGQTLAAKGLHRAAYYPNSVVGILTPTLRQSCRLLRRIRRALPATPHVDATNRAVETLTLSNGSEIVAWPGSRADLIRGDTLDLLLVDEAAWVAEDAFLATLPMLTIRKGSALLASTPGGPSGFLFDVFNDPEKGDEWDQTLITANECPRYSEEDKGSLRRNLGEHGYAVEMMCEWREASDATWTAEEIARILGREIDPDVLPGEQPLPDDEDIDSVMRRIVVPSITELLALARADRAERDRERASEWASSVQ